MLVRASDRLRPAHPRCHVRETCWRATNAFAFAVASTRLSMLTGSARGLIAYVAQRARRMYPWMNGERASKAIGISCGFEGEAACCRYSRLRSY